MVNQGDVIWLDFDPWVGSEQKGRRPALVVSNEKYHKITQKRAIVCPITNTDRNYPAHVRMGSDSVVQGVVLTDQVKVVDLVSRKHDFIERATDEVVSEVLDIIKDFM